MDPRPYDYADDLPPWAEMDEEEYFLFYPKEEKPKEEESPKEG